MLIISALYNLNRDHIFNFVNSLKDSGYNGEKAMIVYNCNSETRRFLESNNWTIWNRNLDGLQTVTKRFLDFYEVLKNYQDTEYVLITDCRDVHFNKNPELFPKSDLVIGQDGEYPLSKHSWAIKEYEKMYSNRYKQLLTLPHLCAGVIFGLNGIVSTLCKDTYDYTFESELYNKDDRGKRTVVDQLALNIVAYTKYKYVPTEQNLVINLAMTTWDQQKQYFLYHQFDRVKNFWNKLNKKSSRIL